MSRHLVRREGKGLGSSLRNRGSARHRHHALFPHLVFARIAVGFWTRLGFPGCGGGKGGRGSGTPGGGGVWSRKISLLSGGSVCGGSVWVSPRIGAAKRPGGPDCGRAHWPGSGWISGSLFCVWGTRKELPLRATVGPFGCHLQALLPKGNFLVHLGTFRKSQSTGEEGRGKLLNLLHRSS